jgi:hypothetical protein
MKLLLITFAVRPVWREIREALGVKAGDRLLVVSKAWGQIEIARV